MDRRVQLIYIVLIILAVWSYQIVRYFIARRRKPYRWKCPVCGFKVETDSPSTFQVSTTSHNHATLNEQRMLDPWQSPETKEACKRFHPGEICVPGKNHPAANG